MGIPIPNSKLGMWLFLGTEIMFFTAFIGTYIVCRMGSPGWPTDVHVTHINIWAGGINTFDQYVSPWLTLVDDARFQATVDRVAALAPSVLAGCHTPAVTGARVAAAIAATRRSPSATVDPQPGQAVLEQIQAALSQPVG
jgi:hypothetical protein